MLQKSSDLTVGLAMAEQVRPERTVRICVGIATWGRPAILEAAVGFLRQQTLQPACIMVSCVSPDDLGTLRDDASITVLFGSPGSSRQRNAILQHAPPDTEFIVFFDDDFVPHPTWLEAVARTFHDHPNVACVTGHVVADGIKGPGIPFEEARDRVLALDHPNDASLVEGVGPYGCNMAFRRQAIGGHRFDERLVLYGWLEDRDFGATLARDGWRLLKIGTAAGIHLGVKKGRVAGHKFGYSQVMNPVYMNRKGTMTPPAVASHVLRNVAANLLHSFSPEPHIDRLGRLKGNWLAFKDLLRGRLTPERAASL